MPTEIEINRLMYIKKARLNRAEIWDLPEDTEYNVLNIYNAEYDFNAGIQTEYLISNVYDNETMYYDYNEDTKTVTPKLIDMSKYPLHMTSSKSLDRTTVSIIWQKLAEVDAYGNFKYPELFNTIDTTRFKLQGGDNSSDPDWMYGGARNPRGAYLRIDMLYYLGLLEERFRGETIFQIESMYRQEPYNTEIGGSPQSLHKTGTAVDIHLPLGNKAANKFRERVLTVAADIGFGGIGTYQNHIHLDLAPFDRWALGAGVEEFTYERDSIYNRKLTPAMIESRKNTSQGDY